MERIHEVHSIDRQASKRIYVVQDEADKDSNGYQTLWFLLNEICLDTQSQDCCGADNLKTFIGTWIGKSTELGVSLCSWKTRIILIGIRG